MDYTVNQVSIITGVSIRTLHYYDEIGLLKPSQIKGNGYRYYGEKELLKLQQILFFKELEFPLEDITKMINSKSFNTKEALRDQKKLLELKRQRIEGLIINIDKTIKKMEGGEDMKTDDLFSDFSDKEIENLKKEAKERWGETDAYKQSMERTKYWTKEDYRKVARDGRIFTQKLADTMDKGIDSPEAQELIKQHHKSIETFYDCPLGMYRNLGAMYVEDPRFTAYYDKFRPGLAKWMKEAIAYYCDTHKE